MPKAPAGFTVELLATGLNQPRTIRVAPNGDAFVAESEAAASWSCAARRPAATCRHAAGLRREPPEAVRHRLLPAGPDPRFVYVGEHHQVVRFPYKTATRRRRGPAQVIVPGIPTEPSLDSRRRGLEGRLAALRRHRVGIERRGRDAGHDRATRSREHEKAHGRGAAWGAETDRAVVRVLRSRREGPADLRDRRCATAPASPSIPAPGDVWCAVNERDGIGDDVPLEYVTSVRDGGFYGWPWYYIGGHEEPRRKGERPDLKAHVIAPDVLLEAHTAPLGITFYDGASFPADYRGSLFVAMHGSWNRSERAGLQGRPRRS